MSAASRRAWLLAVIYGLAAAVAAAHDYWLLPDPLRAAGAADVALTLWVGDDFVPEEQRPWQRARATRFDHITVRGRTALFATAVEGAEPVARVSIDRPGGSLFVLDRTFARITLPAERFERYLHEEGLDAVSALRAARGESDRPGRERYSRSLKAFVQVGPTADGTSMRVVGQMLELVPTADVAALRVGASLPMTVRFRGVPLGGVTIEALSRVGDEVQRAREVSDAHGAVRFAITRDATWLVRATHMVRCEGCADADWESFWTSYTFGVCGAGAARCAAAPMTLSPPDAGSGR